MPLQTPTIDLEARRWRAVVDAVHGKSDLEVNLRRVSFGFCVDVLSLLDRAIAAAEARGE